MDDTLQRNDKNNDRDTDFKQLMLKLKIDDAAYSTLVKGPVVSVIYRLNGVKVSGEDLEVRVCDFIEAKKEERREHERDVARLRSSDSENTTPTRSDNGVKNMLGNGFLKVGGH
jgi:hypothetical protein